MTEQTFTYRDSTLNLKEADNYILLIQVEADSFAYAIVHDQLLVACDTNCDLAELTTPNILYDKLTAEYKNTVISLPAKAFMLVPTELFDVDHTAEFARLLDVREDESVLAQVLDADNYVVYKVVTSLVETVKGYGLKNVVFAAKGWLKAVEQSNPLNSDLFLNMNNNQVEIAYYKRNKLRFYNKFDIATVEDLVYYTIFVSGELELKQQDTNLILSGDIDADSAYYKTLGQYFAKVTINNQELLELPAHIPSHQLLALSALYLCAL